MNIRDGPNNFFEYIIYVWLVIRNTYPTINNKSNLYSIKKNIRFYNIVVNRKKRYRFENYVHNLKRLNDNIIFFLNISFYGFGY